MAKIRILQMIGAAKPGGAEMFAYRLFVALNKHKDVDLLVLARTGSWMEKMLKDAGVPVRGLPFGGIFDFRTKWLAKCVAEQFKPKVIQSWMNRATRFVPKGAWATVGRLGGFYDLKYYRGRVKYLIGNTPEICTYCQVKGWPKAKVSFISNFIPAPEKGWENLRGEMRAKLKVADGDVVMMMSGRLHQVKGVDTALQALAKLPKNVILLLVGEGPLRKELHELTETLGIEERVRWAGWQDNVTPYAAAADIWLAPSRHEPLGNTVLDGWIHEVPVIASNTGGLAMLVKDGVTGLRMEVDDVDGLVKAAKRLMKEPAVAKKLVKGGLAEFDKAYSERVIVGQYVAYYKELAKEIR